MVVEELRLRRPILIRDHLIPAQLLTRNPHLKDLVLLLLVCVPMAKALPIT